MKIKLKICLKNIETTLKVKNRKNLKLDKKKPMLVEGIGFFVDRLRRSTLRFKEQREEGGFDS
jgi:hypothetical protein